ncbi:MAG: GNAT family N-acetyltransferase [Chloroflexota bacterium]
MTKFKQQSTDHSMTRSMALNVTAWTEASVKAYGISTSTTDSIWWRQPGGPGIYLNASTISDHMSDDELAAGLNRVVEDWQPSGFGLYDCWASRDLTPLGFEKVMQSPWYMRPSGPISEVNPPDGLTIDLVKTADQLALFEEASRLGFGDRDLPDPEWESFTQHSPATLANPHMDYIIGWFDGKVVTSVIVHATEDMLGIYGLSTLPQYRRRGFAAALVHAAVALRPELSTCVHPDPPSVPIYTRIGFESAGDLAMWRMNDRER